MLAVQPVSAFDTDTHYYLTYYIAFRSGFTANEAHIIASADYSIDHAGTDSGLLYLHNNPYWHALSSSESFKEEREAVLWQRAVGAINSSWSSGYNDGLVFFGQYIHFTQDRIAHDGYILPEAFGHFYVGHKTDWLAYNRSASDMMLERTTVFMSAFVNIYKGAQAPVLNSSALLSSLIAANPNPQFFELSDIAAGRAVVESALGFSVPPPILFTYNSGGNLVSSDKYSTNPVVSYFAVLLEQSGLTD